MAADVPHDDHGRRSRRYRYGSWRGGPDPLAPPYDVRAAVDQIGADLLSAGNLRDSLRDLLRRGLDGQGGLDRLAAKIAKLRAQARRRGDLGGTLDQVRAALDQALAAERETLAGTDGEDARFAELELDTIPDDVAGAVRALDSYPWRSDEARATYEAIKDMLRREVLDAQFAGLKQALESPDPEAMQRVKDMLADLNALLAAHARNEDTTDAFANFMAQHGEFFPEQPETIEELIDALARQQAAAQRMLASLSPEQREQLSQLMSQALGDADLASEMAQLGDNLRALRPGLDRDSPAGMRPGGESLGYSDAVQAVADLADLEALQAQLSQGEVGSTLDDVDVDLLEKRLGPEAVRDFTALRDLERELEQQGYLTRGDDGLRLTPRAVRRLGQTALRRVFAQLAASGHGDHDDRRTGAADEPTGLTRPWVFGDELPIDAPRTVANALRRRASAGSGEHAAGGRGLRGHRDRTPDVGGGGAVRRPVLLDGAGRPLGADEADRPGPEPPDRDPVPAGRAAGDRLQPAGPSALPGAAGRGRAGLAAGHQPAARADPGGPAPAAAPGRRTGRAGGHRRRADRPPGADGHAYFRWPTTQQTLRATIAEVDELSRYGATINTFMLGEDPGLARFVDAIAQRAGGRVFTPDIGRLGEYVVADYLRARRGRR